MNDPKIWRGMLIAVLCIGIAVAIGASAFHLGLAQGMVASGRVVLAPPGAGPYGYPWHYGWHGFFLGPVFFLFLLLLLCRALFWRRPWRGGCHHHGVPPAFEEWHRRAHEQQDAPRPPSGASPGVREP